jgi:hypothetical protein
MAWYTKASDADLQQSMDLAVEAIRAAREDGNPAREEEFNRDLNGMIEEARARGWKQGSRW